jgi:hypothetical protein
MRTKAAEIADRIKAEVGKAGDAVRAALAIAIVALAVAVAALVTGRRPCHAG